MPAPGGVGPSGAGPRCPRMGFARSSGRGLCPPGPAARDKARAPSPAWFRAGKGGGLALRALCCGRSACRQGAAGPRKAGGPMPPIRHKMEKRSRLASFRGLGFTESGFFALGPWRSETAQGKIILAQYTNGNRSGAAGPRDPLAEQRRTPAETAGAQHAKVRLTNESQRKPSHPLPTEPQNHDTRKPLRPQQFSGRIREYTVCNRRRAIH